MNAVRPSAVAGMFYPGEPVALRAEVDGLLAAARADSPAGRRLKVLVVPHAGYIYSGAMAATAYALLRAQRIRIRRVVLLGPTHRVAVRGIAIPTTDAFATPLGTVPVDRHALADLARLPGVVENDLAHASEHSLEVQLPFLQTVLDRFALVPLAVGHIDTDALATILETIWGGDETLIVVSSDLSHYHGYRDAQQIDRATVARILTLAPGIDHEQACGATPLNAAMAVSRRAGLQPRLLGLCNSGDTAGDRSRVVGYCAIAFEEPTDAGH